MKAKLNILMTLVVMFVLSICVASCAKKPVVEDRSARVSYEVTKQKPLGKWNDCKTCNGKGRCIDCKGKGKINGKECKSCSGSGNCTNCEGQGGFRSEE